MLLSQLLFEFSTSDLVICQPNSDSTLLVDIINLSWFRSKKK